MNYIIILLLIVIIFQLWNISSKLPRRDRDYVTEALERDKKRRAVNGQ